MNILQLITRRQRRGAEVFAARLSEEMMQRGNEAVLAGLYAPPDRSLRLSRGTEADLSQKEPSLLPSPKIMKTIALCLDDFDIELIQANAGDTLKYAVLSRRLYGWDVPILYRNASIMSHWARGWMRKRFNRWLLMQCSAVVSVSRRSLRDIREEMEIRHIRTEYIPNGVDCTKGASRARDPLDIPEDAILLLHVGSFSQEKRHDLLLRYFDRLSSETDAPLHLVLIGDGPLWSEIQREVLEHPRSRQISLPGSVEELRPYYDRADLLLLTSEIEGVPGVVLEAGAREVPTVALDVGGMSECIRDGTTGLLVKKGDDASYIKACLQLIEDESRRRQYGSAARAFICEHFDMQTVADRFERLYRDILENDTD